jgi:7,8-dihydropterin-6-yl-methyl-4-(beta-D-ribofuranosyl)aminobenzene 5'-phosphate synthase
MSTPAKLTRALLAACLTLAGTCVCANQAQPRLASSVEITILSSNLADGATVGEWGFSALARTGDACVLFDAGRHPDTVIRNVRALGVDLSCVTDLVLSHFHFDHTTGVLPLLEQMQAQHGSAFRRIHVAEGFFLPRRLPDQTAEWNGMIAAKDELERRGVEIIEHGTAAEILPGIWVTGPVIRTHAEKTYPKAIRMYLDGDWVEDYVPDSQG